MMLGVKGFGDRHVEYSMGEGEIFVFTKKRRTCLTLPLRDAGFMSQVSDQSLSVSVPFVLLLN